MENKKTNATIYHKQQITTMSLTINVPLIEDLTIDLYE